MNSPDSLRPRRLVVWAFFAYAFLARVGPYVLYEGLGWPLRSAYEAYPWNFSPLYALAVFAGAVLSLRMAILTPLAVYFASDLVIAAISGNEWGTYTSQIFTYLAIGSVAACGLLLRGRVRATGIAFTGIAGATLFFVVSNLGVWLTHGGFARPLTPAGLFACFVDALPFYGPTLLSMAIFLPVLFSPLVLAPAKEPTSVSL